MIFLSVIIPTRNRADLLNKTLQSILGQTLNPAEFEVIVIDNGSTDNTRQIFETVCPFLPNVKYIYDKTPGLHVGRNKGYQTAAGDVLVYIDDDIQAFPEWLETLKNIFADNEVVMAGGKNLPLWESDPPQWIKDEWESPHRKNKCVYQLSILDLGDEVREIDPNFVFGCNFSVRKELVNQACGFHPDGMPKELIRFRGDGETYLSQMALQSGKKTIYHPGASVYHWVSKSRMTPEYFKERSFSQGISDSYTDLRNQATPRINRKTKVKRIIRQGKTFIKEIIKGRKADIAISELSRNPYEDGYKFHQKQFYQNQEMKEWVVKPHYLCEDEGNEKLKKNQ